MYIPISATWGSKMRPTTINTSLSSPLTNEATTETSMMASALKRCWGASRYKYKHTCTFIQRHIDTHIHTHTRSHTHTHTYTHGDCFKTLGGIQVQIQTHTHTKTCFFFTIQVCHSPLTNEATKEMSMMASAFERC